MMRQNSKHGKKVKKNLCHLFYSDSNAQVLKISIIPKQVKHSRKQITNRLKKCFTKFNLSNPSTRTN